MSLISLAKKYETELYIPPWKYADYFENDIKQLEAIKLKTISKEIINIKEPHYHYTPEYWDAHANEIKNKTVNLSGWFQSPKYWEGSNLRFKKDFIEGLKNKYADLFQKPTIAISVRRGDFVNNPNYYQLPIQYYVFALLYHFPDFYNHNILIFSDDLPYCKVHFQSLENAHFIQENDISQLALLTLCDNFIISNSTFSVAGAYLRQNKTGKVIRPKYNLAGKLARTHDEKDFWCEDWTVYDYENQKWDLTDTTFIVPVYYDHRDRKENLSLSVCMIQRHFNTNIIIGEQGAQPRFESMGEFAQYIHFKGMKHFHRTKMLNDMTLAAKTPIVVNFDCDNVVPPLQLILAIDKLRRGQADFVYPFDGQCARVPRIMFNKVSLALDIGILGHTELKGLNKFDSVGNALAYNRQAFIEAGMENENMISWGPEDIERYERFKRLGFKIERIGGALYHMDHWCGPNSSSSSAHYKSNWAELEKERKMTADELRAYIATWRWVHPYTDCYYETIQEEAIKSRDEIFKLFPLKDKKVIDIGCGIAEFGFEAKEKFGCDYYGLDYKIPKRKLLIPETNYIEHDLRTHANGLFKNQKFDLVLCLEVAEHLEDKYSEQLVRFLCSLGDTILFSAAIPYQPGVGHINCRWQSWWEKLFNEQGFYQYSDLSSLRGNKNILCWYRQNTVLYVKKEKNDHPVKDYVDPEMWENVMQNVAS